MQFIGVAWQGDDESFQGFIDKHGLTFPQVSDDDGAIYNRFSVPAQPALVIIDAAGRSELFFGAVEPEQLESLITDALD